MLFGHLPGQLRGAAVMVGKRIVFSRLGGSVSGAGANEQKKGSSDEHLAAGTVNCSLWVRPSREFSCRCVTSIGMI